MSLAPKQVDILKEKALEGMSAVPKNTRVCDFSFNRPSNTSAQLFILAILQVPVCFNLSLL